MASVGTSTHPLTHRINRIEVSATMAVVSEAARLRADFAGVPVDDTADLLGLTAARVYGFDLDALAPVAERVGPSPQSLGQDPAVRSDPAVKGGARWWKKEYGLEPG